MTGKCKICGCTHERPCPDGCHWSDREDDLCSNCDELTEAIDEWEMLRQAIETAQRNLEHNAERIVVAFESIDKPKITYKGYRYQVLCDTPPQIGVSKAESRRKPKAKKASAQ